MVQFFSEGRCGIYPVLLMGVILIGASIRYAIDVEPVRLRLIAAISLALVATMVHATCFAAVFRYLERSKDERIVRTLMIGLVKTTRPAILGGALLTVGLVLVAVGACRSGQRELRALRS